MYSQHLENIENSSMDIGLDSVEGFMALIIHLRAIICFTVIRC